MDAGVDGRGVGGGWLPVQVFVELENCGHVAAAVAVVGCAPHGHEGFVEHVSGRGGGRVMHALVASDTHKRTHKQTHKNTHNHTHLYPSITS